MEEDDVYRLLTVRRGVAVGCVAVALCVALSGIEAQMTVARGSQESTEAVALRSGRMGNYLWASFIEHPERPAERRAGAICLAVFMLEPLPGNRAEGNEVAGCQQPPSDQPWLEVIAGGHSGKVRTAIAAVFPGGVKSVTLKVKGEPAESIRAQSAHLPTTFNVAQSVVPYIGHGYPYRVCVQRIEGFDATGARITRLLGQPCI